MAYAERGGPKSKLTGRWVCDAQYKHADGSVLRWHKAFALKGEAEGAEAYFRATGERPPGHTSAPTHSFAAIADEFKHRNPAWLKAHDGVTNGARLDCAIARLGKLDIRMVRTRELLAYRDYVVAHAGRAKKPPANRTVNYYLDAVGKVLQFALDMEYIDTRPTMPRLENTGEHRDALRWPLEDAIVQAMETRGRYVEAFCVRLLAATGLRAGELHSLTPEQIETPDTREQSGIMLNENNTKTKSARWVPLLPEAATKLRAIIGAQGLPNPSQVYDSFKAALKSLGENPKLTIHCLRHTTVTRLLESGASNTDVAAITGHIIPGTVKMQLRYYHPDRAYLFSVAEKVQCRLGEITKKSEVVPFASLARTA